MFNIGDRVVYPMHGAGRIVDKAEKEVLGEVHNYFILKMPVSDLKISIPGDRMKDMGVRPVSDKVEVDKIKGILAEDFKQVSSNWNRRHKMNLNKLKLGNLTGIAEVFRDLYVLDAEKGLSMVEKKLLNTSKRMLLSEVALISDQDADQIEKEYKDILYQRHIKK